MAAISEGVISELRILGNGRSAEVGAAVAFELQGHVYALVHDSFGNVIALSDRNGRLIESYRYSAFGEMQTFKIVDHGIYNPWRYSSKRFDAETGFFYFGQRHYAPDIGHWITPDPAGFEDGPNLYAYVQNHPLSCIDPDGRFAMFLVPMAISLAADYCLPAACLYLAEYAGGTMAAGFLTGLVTTSLFLHRVFLDRSIRQQAYANAAVCALGLFFL
jgi:RHS repeat-associated protein